jgi:hypothetical protein
MTGARTAGQGKFEMTFGIGAQTIAPFGLPIGGGMPQTEIAARYGVLENLDIGGRAWITGVAADVKVNVLKTDFLLLTLDPSATWMGFSIGGTGPAGTNASFGANTFFFQLPILFGIPIGGGSEIVLAPKLVDWLGNASGFAGVNNVGVGDTAWATVLLGGGSIGVKFMLNPNFGLLPELAIVQPLWGSAGLSSSSTGGNITTLPTAFHASLGFIFGS